jgi:hypothetical protein
MESPPVTIFAHAAVLNLAMVTRQLLVPVPGEKNG